MTGPTVREIMARAIHAARRPGERFEDEDPCFALADAVLAALTDAGLYICRYETADDIYVPVVEEPKP